MLFFNKKLAGFTVMELMVSTFIITLISGIFLANYHSTNKRSELILVAQKLVSNIRLMQVNSLGAVELANEVPEGGWGVHFNQGYSNYIIFADIDGDYIYDGNEEYKTISLPGNIIINSIDIGNSADIVFAPPDPITYINTDPVTNVRIELTDGESSKTIEVNFLGLIDMVD